MRSSVVFERILTEFLRSHIDSLESELCKELENARIVRLIAKLGFINERPEFGMDPHWSETGDRYLLKLFRDYVFHQVDSHGHPVVDMAHVISCLNKVICMGISLNFKTKIFSWMPGQRRGFC